MLFMPSDIWGSKFFLPFYTTFILAQGKILEILSLASQKSLLKPSKSLFKKLPKTVGPKSLGEKNPCHVGIIISRLVLASF